MISKCGGDGFAKLPFRIAPQGSLRCQSGGVAALPSSLCFDAASRHRICPRFSEIPISPPESLRTPQIVLLWPARAVI
jgi:hypothetical protein